jgi:hypothetical protein
MCANGTTKLFCSPVLQDDPKVVRAQRRFDPCLDAEHCGVAHLDEICYEGLTQSTRWIRNREEEMGKASLLAIVILLLVPQIASSQQLFRAPDPSALRHLTSKASEHAADIPGKETTMDFYSAPNGQIITLYIFKGKKIAFSVHSNEDVQKTYRLFMDMNGDGLFQEINRGARWEIPAWAR